MTQGDEGRHEAGLSDALIDYDRVADIYDLYVTSELDVGFYVEEAGKAEGKVLELMCGTGRISVPLLEAGVDLTCVDASEGMLARLEERLRARKLEARTMRADVRYLDLHGEEFELALIPFHSFSELVSPRDRELALRAIYACLKTGGHLICPLHNPAIRARSADGALKLNGSFPTADGGLLVVSGFEGLDEDSSVVGRIQLYEFFDASNNLRTKRVLPMRFALIARSEFAELANAAGLVPVALYGDYHRGEYQEDSSPFMIWILEKVRRPLVEAPSYRSSYGEEGPLSETQAVGITHLPIDVGTNSAPRVQFSATVGEEPQVEVRLVHGYSEEDERG